jgi:hypothetical protein
MVTITVYPPQEEPKQLTVNHRPENLQEHMLAFLNVNNAKGFPLLTTEETENLGNLLYDYATQSRVIKHADAARMAMEIRRRSGKKIKFMRAYEYLARCFGYYSWRNVLGAVKQDGQLVNLNYGKVSLADIFQFDAEQESKLVTVKGVNHPEYLTYQRMGGHNCKNMPDMINLFARNCRTESLRMNYEIAREIALKRWFGVKTVEELIEWVAKRRFPPLFDLDVFEYKEAKLRNHLRAPMFKTRARRDDILMVLNDWCQSESILNYIREMLDFLCSGRGDLPYFNFFTRQYGICGVEWHEVIRDGENLSSENGGIMLFTENDKITQAYPMKELDRKTMVTFRKQDQRYNEKVQEELTKARKR